MKLKELKAKLEALTGMDDADVAFGAEAVKGLYFIDDVTTGKFEGEVPEGCTKDMVLLWNGAKE